MTSPVRRVLPFLSFRTSASIECTDCSCLLCPLLTSASDFRADHSALSRVLHDQRQISRGKPDRLPRTTAGFTTSAFDGYWLRDRLPARPAPLASYPVLVHRLAPLLHASFRPRPATTPLRFANPSPPSGWVEDFHLQAVEHARHTDPGTGAWPCPPHSGLSRSVSSTASTGLSIPRIPGPPSSRLRVLRPRGSSSDAFPIR